MIKQKFALIAAVFGLIGGALSGVIGSSWAGRNGSGTYSLPSGNPVVTGTQISSTWANNTLNDIATALTASIAKDGQTVPTANLPMGGFRHTGVGDASSRTNYASAGQVQDAGLTLAGTVAGSDTITAALTPAISSYSDGMHITLFPAAPNSGVTTLAVNGLTARSVIKGDGDPLEANDLVTGVPAELVYDATSSAWSLLNPQTTVTGISPTDLAHLSTANDFTSGSLTLEATGTSHFFAKDSSAGSDAKLWTVFATSGNNMSLGSTYTDAGAAVANGIVLTRSGTTITELDLAATDITLNGINATDYARLSQSNTFTGTVQRIASTNGGDLYLKDTDAAANEKESLIAMANGQLLIDSLTDDEMGIVPLFSATRSGAFWSQASLGATQILLNGVDVSTYAITTNNLSDLSNAGTARTNLGLGSMATQASSAVSISGGTISGAAIDAGEITTGTLALGRGGTGQTTQAGITRQNTLTWTIASDPGGTPSGSPGDVFAYY